MVILNSRLAACAFLLLALQPTCATAADLPLGTPVGGSMLNENHLVLRDANIEIPPPSDENWQWREMPERNGVPHAFLCVNSHDGQVVAIIPQDVRALLISDDFIAHMWQGINRTAEESQLSLADRYHRRIDLTHGSAVLFHYTSSGPEHATLHVFTYLIPTGRVCLIQASAATATIPAFLTAAASGARPLRRMGPQEVFPAVKTASSLWSYLLIGMATFAIASERIRRRLLPRNPWSAVLLSFPVVYAFWIGLVYQTGVFDDMTRAEAQQACGYIAGTPMLLSLVCAIPWVIRRRRLRRSMTTEA